MRAIISFILVLTCSFTLAQAEHVIEIDKGSGAFWKVCSPIPGVTFVAPEDGVYDENKGVFYFISASPCACLQGISTINGAVVSSPPISQMMTFQFDNVSNNLYALKQDNANNVKYFGKVNPANGFFTPIGPSRPGSALYQGSLNAFDETQHYFIYLEPGNILVTIDAVTGNVLYNPPLQIVTNTFVHGFAFNKQNGTLYGLLYDVLLLDSWLVTINPQTGTCTKVGGPLIGLGPAASAAIDEANGEYIFLHNGNSPYTIASIDLNTGALLSSVNVVPLPSPENAFNLAYDRQRERLFAMHWSNSSVYVALEENQLKSFNIVPNPATDQLSISTDSQLMEVSIFDNTGSQLIYLQGDNRTIDIQHLSQGIYFINIKTVEGVTRRRFLKL